MRAARSQTMPLVQRDKAWFCRARAGPDRLCGRAGLPPPGLTVPLFQDTVAVGSELQGLKVKRLYVGGLPPSSEEEVPQGLVGCIQVGLRTGT